MVKRLGISLLLLSILFTAASCYSGGSNLPKVTPLTEATFSTDDFEDHISPIIIPTETMKDDLDEDTSATDDNQFIVQAIQRFYEYDFMQLDSLNWQFDIADKTLYITGNGPMREYSSTIPGWYSDYSNSIEHIIVCEGVTSVGSFAFSELKNLRSVSLPSTLECICDSTFENCNYLNDVNIPSGLKYIGKNAFKNCILDNTTYLVFPEGMEYIAENAFTDGLVGAKTILIPSTVYYIGAAAFCNASIQSIVVAEDNNYYCSVDNVLYSKNMSLLLQVSNTRDYGDFVIPEEVTRIASGAFNLSSGIKTITFPQGITTIDESAFAFTSNLEEFIMPSDNEHFFVDSGMLCSIDNLTVLAYVTAFYNTSLVIPDGMERIGSRAFTNNDALYRVYFPDSLKSIGEKAFFYSGITSLIIPNNLEIIEENAFFGAPIAELSYYGSEEAIEKLIILDGNDNIDKSSIVIE